MRDYEPIIIKVKENGLLDIDEEKLKELLKDAFTQGYNEGYIEGSKLCSTTTNPIPTVQPYKVEPIDITKIGDPPDWYKFGPTCTGSTINFGSEENVK